ncbi:MAG: SDR family oxidoreductase [Phycisphaerae bacterium]|nr:SDR family oxidoreductase [Phycisphaerae bacterium]MCZ2400217.1 SDR family oxidoreductase [Phycisphaerae bacterium]
MSADGAILITGATGFIGHYVLGELLRQGRRCVALVRDRPERLQRLLQGAGAPAPTDGRLLVAPGALPDRLPDLRRQGIRQVVHLAANTRFDATASEPHRTNVEGMRRLLAWAEAHGVEGLTLVSTAYVCGLNEGPVPERIEPVLPRFRNAYEESKWHAEALATRWEGASRRVAIVRPTVVTGAWDTGRATEFRGFYLLARSVEMLAQGLDTGADGRRTVPLRLPGRPEDAAQIVPVDFVARAVAHAVTHAEARGVFHLAHPRPPSNAQMKAWLEEVFDIGGGEFAGDAAVAEAHSPAEALFHSAAASLSAYFAHSPRFCMERAAALLSEVGIACPPIDGAYVGRIIAYAQRAAWGRGARRQRAASGDVGAYCAAYFERFLPEHLPRSSVSRLAPVRATIRFVIEDGPGEWVCQFAGGRVVQVGRGANQVREDFGYRASGAGFWRAISGAVDGEQLFLGGEADVFGDVERALMMSAILREFTREFPCDRERLAPYLVPSCS